MKVIITFLVSFLVFSESITAQNPLPLLKSYRYDINNNNIKLGKELESLTNNLMYTNIFMRYSKNPQYNQTFSPVKIMLFKINYEHIFQTKISSNDELQFEFALNKDSKIVSSKIVTMATKDGKLSEKKIKRKSYDFIRSDRAIKFKIDRSKLGTDDIIRIYWKTESVNFNAIYVNICQLKSNFEQYISLNVPDIFTYKLDDPRLNLVELNKSEMMLKQFSYDVSRLVENSMVGNKTYQWKIIKNENSNPIKFPLLSINLPPAIGTSVEEILHQ